MKRNVANYANHIIDTLQRVIKDSLLEECLLSNLARKNALSADMILAEFSSRSSFIRYLLDGSADQIRTSYDAMMCGVHGKVACYGKGMNGTER